jgi:hypothetical protein
MFEEKNARHSSIRVVGSVAALLLAIAVSGQADINVTGTFTGTFYTSSVAGSPIDALGAFGAVGANLTGQTITGSFTYDASTLPLVASGPGYTQYQTINDGSVSETVNGHTISIGSSAYMSLFLAEPPYVTSGNVFDLEAAGDVPSTFVYGHNFEYEYVRLEWVSAPFLNGLGNAQTFSAPSPTAGGVDLFIDFNYDPHTGGYNSVVEELPFVGSLTSIDPAPEPAMLPVLCAGFVGLGILCIRRREQNV